MHAFMRLGVLTEKLLEPLAVLKQQHQHPYPQIYSYDATHVDRKAV